MTRSVATPEPIWTPKPGRSLAPAEAPARAASSAIAGTRSGWAMRLAYFCSDCLAIVAAVGLVEFARGLLAPPSAAAANIAWKLDLLLALGLLSVAYIARTYAAIPPRPVRQFRAWVFGGAMCCASLVGSAWLLGIGSWQHAATLTFAALFAILGASFCRALCRSIFGKQSWWGTRLIVVGNCELASQALLDLLQEPQWGLRPVGFVSDEDLPAAKGDWRHYLGRTHELNDLAARLAVDRALVVAHSFDVERLADALSRPGGQIRHWILLPPLTHVPSLWLEDCEAARLPALAVTNRLALPWSRALKRFADLLLTSLIAIPVLPLIALVALLVRISSPGPILFGSERVGRGGRRFLAWKFRTMYRDAESLLAEYLDAHPSLAAEWQANTKLRHDPRVTWIGHWLRVTSLDELPQIWNVFLGQMSLVGPRPILPGEVDKYAEGLEHYREMLPGITGLWQVSGRNNTTYRERVELDTYYVKNWSLWLDIYILACTVKVVLLGEGAY
jgi:Undecaprenyl-phosphate galactose phosphotransferase WbaP